MPIQLTDQMRTWLDAALADGATCLVGTATKDGHPQISPKGSVGVFDETRLFYWERALKSAKDNVGQNPHVMVYFRNPGRSAEIPYPGAAIRFYGDARIVSSGPEFDRAWELTIPAEKQRDPDKKGVGVIIDLTKVEQLNGTAIMSK